MSSVGISLAAVRSEGTKSTAKKCTYMYTHTHNYDYEVFATLLPYSISVTFNRVQQLREMAISN